MKILRFEEVKDVPLRDDLTPEELVEAYRLAREAFTADDLAEYCNIDETEWVDADEFIAELEEMQKQYEARQ